MRPARMSAMMSSTGEIETGERAVMRKTLSKER
jgi:hypothetical protein